MDFTLDEQQGDVRDLAAGLLDRFAVGSTGSASRTEFDAALWTALAESGLLGIAVPDEDGGSGAGFLELCLVVEEAARHAAAVPLVETAVLAAAPVAEFGTAEQRARLLPGFCDGSAPLTASGALVDGRAPTLDVAPDQETGGWRVRGTTSHVPLADRANRVLVPALDDAARPGWFLVDPTAAGATLRAHTSTDRLVRHHLELDLVVPPADVLAAPGADGDRVTQWVVDHGTAAWCVWQAAACDAAVRMTAEYVREREQFGRPVGSFQGVAHRVADAYIDVTGMRLSAWRAAWLLADEQPITRELAVAAWWATDAGARAIDAAMHLHGGVSVDLDFPIHRYYLAERQGELALGGPSSRLAALGDLLAVA